MATPMQMVPQPGGATAIAKAFVVTRIDVTQHPVETFISLMGAAVYFLEDLQPADREKYEAQIKVARGVTDAKDRLEPPRIVLPGMNPPPGFNRGRS